MKAYLGAIIGTDGIPIVSVIQDEKPEPDDTIYESFVDRAISRAPMKGTNFTNNTRTFHFSMEYLTTGVQGEQWIHPLAQFQNGRKDWLHYMLTTQERVNISARRRLQTNLAETFLTRPIDI